MKCWYTLFLLLLCTLSLQSQSVVQTFVDRCTGETKVITIPFEGSTVVVFYNKSRSFTINDVRSGELQAWLEETYLWWSSISPCSTNQATTTATQTTTQNATQNATAAATAPPPQTSSASNQTSSTESSSSSTASSTESSGSNDSGSDSSSQESTDSSESSSDSEESTETESESDSEESDESSESDDSEEEDDKKQSQKKSNPVVIAANVATMSALDGAVNVVTNLGLSQASLSGVTSYSLNVMVWDNLKQFNLNLGRSITNKEHLVILKRAGSDVIKGGGIKSISTTSINAMYSFGMLSTALGSSKVYLLDKNTMVGWASNLMVMSYQNNFTFIPTAVGFATKPYTFDRTVVSPMIAVAFNPVIYNTLDGSVLFNSNAMMVFGASNSFNLTRNFYVNLGVNIVESTANLPMTWSATIGSRFQF
jgi:hypothetical protein